MPSGTRQSKKKTTGKLSCKTGGRAGRMRRASAEELHQLTATATSPAKIRSLKRRRGPHLECPAPAEHVDKDERDRERAEGDELPALVEEVERGPDDSREKRQERVALAAGDGNCSLLRRH